MKRKFNNFLKLPECFTNIKKSREGLLFSYSFSRLKYLKLIPIFSIITAFKRFLYQTSIWIFPTKSRMIKSFTVNTIEYLQNLILPTIVNL